MDTSLLNIGLYTSLEASRLLGTSANKINSWLKGYEYKDNQEVLRRVEPLWNPEIEIDDRELPQLSFRDLMEVRFVEAFRKSGLPLQTIRSLYLRAKILLENDRPFSSRIFKTDGKTIFLDDFEKNEGILDLKNYQHAFKRFIEPTFKDIEYADNKPIRWHPSWSKGIVLDPQKSFGQPVIDKYWISTETLYVAFLGSESLKVVSSDYQIPILSVKEAINFQEKLQGVH